MYRVMIDKNVDSLGEAQSDPAGLHFALSLFSISVFSFCLCKMDMLEAFSP